MVEYLCIIQARVNSSRLPAKVMLDLSGKTLVERVVETVSKSKKVQKVIVATSNESTDDIIEEKFKNLNTYVYRGSLNNVLERFYKASREFEAKNIVRITADNPLMDASIIDKLIEVFETKDCEYSMFTNAVYGLSAEVFSYSALEEAYKFSRDDFDKEHVTPYIKDNSKVYTEDIEEKYKKPNISATIDTLEDYIKIQKFYFDCFALGKETNIDNYLNYMDKLKNES